MAVYKVPQDVEADDKLLGPFTFKQFIFLLLAIAMGWLSFVIFRVSPLLVIIPLPFMLIFAILGLPLRKDQPTDVYVAALINYWVRPKVRLWDQEGIAEHVIVTAPKKEEVDYTRNLSTTEVRSRLNSLAKTMDTRGWSVKHADIGGFTPGYTPLEASDRLVAPSAPQEVVEDYAAGIEDVLDTEGRLAQNFARLEVKSGTATTEQKAAATPAEAPTAPGSVISPTQTAAASFEEEEKEAYPEMHQKVISPDKPTQVTKQKQTDILEVDKNSGASEPAPPQSKSFDEGGTVSLR